MRNAAILTLLLVPLVAAGQNGASYDPCAAGESDPLPCYHRAMDLGTGSNYHRLSRATDVLLAQCRTDPLYYFEIAELMKWAGNPRAEYYYEQAIESDPAEPAFELFLADYFRNFRGPLKPLFPQAEAHYFRACRKLERLNAPSHPSWDEEVARRVERGLIALYQEEGIPLRGHVNFENWLHSPRSPLIFFSSINHWAQPTGDFDNVDDVRAFTSEALLAAQRRFEDAMRRHENIFPGLSKDEFRSIIRVKPQFETLARVRFRYKALPALEFTYHKRELEHTEITDFAVPNGTNDVRVNNEFGAAIEKPFSLPGAIDVFIRGGYNRIDRTGLIEGAPTKHEIINEYEARIAASRFFGPDKAILQTVYVYQDINQKLDNPALVQKRDRQIVSGKLTYDLLRFKFASSGSLDNRRDFGLYGWTFFGGVAYDNERWDETTLRKNDYFAGSELRGVNVLGKSHPFDLSYQATIFTSEVRGNPISLASLSAAGPPSRDTSLSFASSIEPADLLRRRNTQIRHNAALLLRLKDEEREPFVPEKAGGWFHPAFIHLVIPAKYDVSLDRHKEFENFRIGGQIDVKFYNTSFGGTSYLLSVGYSKQWFFNLGRSLDLASASFGIGF